jgi:peptidoglycan/LPS O-acetylase OafA/YrhL
MDARLQELSGKPHAGRARLSFESVASHSGRYRADVDGLRAVAVVSVLLYHLEISGFRNGYVGVDVFYVISGYLITSLIAREMVEDRFSIIMFYERRMRRIFPALFTMLICATLVATVLLYPQELARFGKSLLTTTFFASNLYFWHSALASGYFDTTNAPAPLLHTWSLAVEEQFYLLFPVTLYALFRWARGKAVFWLLLVSAISFGFNIWTTKHKPIFAFYWLMPRAWELLIGSLLALRAMPGLANRIMREAAALIGIGMIVGSVMSPVKGIAFPGYFVLLPCVGAGLIIYAGETGPSLVSKVLSCRPIVFIGVISYSLYLWHWPAIAFSRHLPFRLSRDVEIAFVLLFSILVSFLSFEYIERPFRGGSSRFSRRQIFALGLMVSVLAAVFGIAAYRTQGLPGRYGAKTRQIVLTNQDRMSDFIGLCGNWKAEIRSISDIRFCDLGEPTARKIVFWGDSHLEQFRPVLEDLQRKGQLEGREALLSIEAGCFPDKHLNTRGGFHCDSFAKFAEMRAQLQDVDLVFLGFSTWLARWDNSTCLSEDGRCLAILSKDALRKRLVSDIADEIRTLRSSGKRVVVCLPFPIYNEKIPDVAISNALFGRFGLIRRPLDVTSPSLRDEIRTASIGAGADIFDPRATLCRGSNCLTEIDGVSIYKDESHLAFSEAHLLEDDLRQVIQRNLAAPAAPRSQ